VVEFVYALLFFVSALAAGLVYVIIVSKLTQMFMRKNADERYLSSWMISLWHREGLRTDIVHLCGSEDHEHHV